jgi:hypothetical protein
MTAHVVLDKLCREIGRGETYKWLALAMGMEQRDCHIGMFNIEQCHQVVNLVAAR